jgi:L-alanine-DL-glutamate epimerase-like enolase superfamily enzyme
VTDLDTSFERLTLDLDRPFTIARGTQTETENVVVRIGDGEHVGVGAAAPSTRYGETAGTVEAVLPDLLAVVEDLGDPHAIQRAHREMDAVVRDNPAAKAAVDVALHDLAAERLDVPLYRALGLDPDSTVTSSYTVGIDDLDTVAEKAAAAVDAGYGVLKVKLGTDRDRAIVETVREAAPDARLRVDANEAWGVTEAVDKIQHCADHGVEFVEQPVPAYEYDAFRRVRERSALPLAADESCVVPEDVARAAEVADIANVKLMKCGGVRPALRTLHAARAHGMETMLGCMVECNAAIAAAWHLAPLLDYADLDGSLLLAADPFEGVPMPGGRVDLSGVERGTGAREA